MRRSSVLVLTMALALATAVALLRAEAVWRTPALGAAPAAAANEALVRRFYDAANEVIRTGDLEHLDPVIAVDLVVHHPLAGKGPGGADLARSLLAIRATTPDRRFRIQSLVAGDDRVMVQVTVDPGSGGSFLGIPIAGDAIAAWGTVDVFRIVRGRIVEHWSIGDNLGHLEPLAQASAAELPTTPAIVGLTRFTYAPSATSPQHTDLGPVLAVVETGSLTVRVEGAAMVARGATADADQSWQPTPAAVAFDLRPGDRLLLPAATKRTFDNPGRGEASLLAMIVFPAGKLELPANAGAGQARWDVRWPIRRWPGITADSLAGGVTTLADASVTLAIGRVTLAPGARLIDHQFANPGLVVVERGTLGITMPPESATIVAHRTDGADALVPPADQAALTPGDSLFLARPIAPAGSLTLANGGATPLTVLVVRVFPSGRSGASLGPATVHPR